MHSVRENKHNDISINNASKFKAVKLQQSKTGKLKKEKSMWLQMHVQKF